MKLVFIREKLVQAMSIVIRMVSNQVTLPILSNVLFKVEDGRLKIAATDLEVGIETWIGAKIEKTGAVTIPAKLLFDLLHSINDDKLTLIEQDNKITITGDNSKSLIKGLSANDFPLIPKIKNPIVSITIDAKKLKQAIIENAFTPASDETRPVLTGMLFKINKDNFIIAATDSYRLSETKIINNEKNLKEINTIIPKRTMIELSRIINDKDEKIKINFSENQIAFELNNVYYISRLIEGSFPEYEQIIPKKYNLNITLEKENLLNGLKTANLFSRDQANNIKIEVRAGEGLLIKSYSQQIGENESLIKVKKVLGANQNFSINAIYLQDAINAINEKNINIELVDSQSPIKISGEKNDKYFCIIMPLRQE